MLGYMSFALLLLLLILHRGPTLRLDGSLLRSIMVVVMLVFVVAVVCDLNLGICTTVNL